MAHSSRIVSEALALDERLKRLQISFELPNLKVG
jgi:hypothetical protein